MEPFCGGAAIALELIIENKVKYVVINDYDYTIYCFWDSLLNHTNDFIKMIRFTNVTIDEWNVQIVVPVTITEILIMC